MELNIIYIRVGTTRSGKMIPYISSINDLDILVKYFEGNFSVDDLLDVFAVYSYLALRGMRRGDEMAIFDRHAIKVQDLLELQEISCARKRAKIKSAFDLRDLGRSLVAFEFADF